MGSDDAPEPDASHLTPEEKHGPRTIHVALALLATLLLVAVVTDPASVLPRDSTLHGDQHLDEASGLQISVPVGWRASSRSEFGSVQIAPTGAGRHPDTRIVAGRLEAVSPASAFPDHREAAEALAETIQLHLIGVEGARDDIRVEEVENDAGEGASFSYVVAPRAPAEEESGGLVYVAVFGEGDDRWWVGYVTSSQGSAPGPGWVDRIVGGIRVAE